ncbi:MAG: RNA polymerase factor sigma-54 [Pseudomonadota bacterium]
MKPGLQLKTSQTLGMTPQLLQSIRLLQLSTQELQQELREALERNVMLEPAEDEEDEAEPHVEPAETAVADPLAEVSGSDPAATEQVEADYDWSSREAWSGGEPRDDGDEPWEARIAAPRAQDARLAALEQLQLLVSTPREAQLVAAILDAIDDNGYLAQPLDGIAAEAALQPPPDQAELEAALAKVQSVEPSGFGARDLRECLLLQLRMMPAGTPALALAVTLVETRLERIAGRDFDGLRADLDVDALELHDALDLILSLDPKPGAAATAAAEAAVPDVVVVGTRGAWKVSLNAERLPRLRVNRTYERMLDGAGAHRALRDQLQEARWLVRGVEMRHDTLLRTARAIFERQQAFLERGEEGMAPLTLREIADTIGMHESTVCRVTTNKWVQTPWGVYELKAFFPSQINGREGETSGTAVKAMIRRIINAESTNCPLCDGDIAAILARNGVRVARRTVAKYREAMRIPPAKERSLAESRRHLRLVS